MMIVAILAVCRVRVDGGVSVQPRSASPGRSDDPEPSGDEVNGQQGDLWEQIFCQQNLLAALKRVEQNAGAPGVDGMTTGEASSVVPPALG